MRPILHDASLLPEGDSDLLTMVQETFDQARRVLGADKARTFIRLREADLYRHLEAVGLGHSVPRIQAVYRAFWRLHAGM